MYKFSHRAEGPWMGEFDNPQSALNAGRALLDVTRVWVGQMEQAYFTDMFMGGRIMLAYMRENAQGMDDEFDESFERLPGGVQAAFGRYVETAIGEWETELPKELQFTGETIKTKRGYTTSEQVRKPHFATFAELDFADIADIADGT